LPYRKNPVEDAVQARDVDQDVTASDPSSIIWEKRRPNILQLIQTVKQKAWQMHPCCDLYGDSHDGAASPTPAEAAAALFAVSSFARLKNLRRVFARKGPELFAFADLNTRGKIKGVGSLFTSWAQRCAGSSVYEVSGKKWGQAGFFLRRDEGQIDIFWLRHESLEEFDKLPMFDEDLEAALEQFRESSRI
jgi:hypothetical protein